MPWGGARSAMGMCKMEYILTDNESIVASCLRLGGNVPENVEKCRSIHMCSAWSLEVY